MRQALILGLLVTPAFAAPEVDLSRLHLPPGFEIELYAANVPEARQMALSPAGVLYVGSRNRGEVRALVDEDHDGRVDRMVVIARGLRMPTGLAFRDGSLFVAAVDRILRYDQIDTLIDTPPAPAVLTDDLPQDAAHGWKTLRFGPDGWLYFAIGAPCNIAHRPRRTRLSSEFARMAAAARRMPAGFGIPWAWPLIPPMANSGSRITAVTGWVTICRPAS